jgi:quercetin dioxygenase-like cupin family protein
MTDNDATLTLDDQVTHIPDVLATAPIQPDKIGHHTVLSAGGARVIVLALDAGQTMREHRTHHPIVLHALDGKVRVTADGSSYDLSPGGLLYLPNAMPHSVEAVEPSRISITPFGV